MSRATVSITFFVVGLPGLALAALVMTIKEPYRRGRLKVDGEAAQPGQLKQFAGFVMTHWKAFAGLFASFTLLVLIALEFCGRYSRVSVA